MSTILTILGIIVIFYFIQQLQKLPTKTTLHPTPPSPSSGVPVVVSRMRACINRLPILGNKLEGKTLIVTLVLIVVFFFSWVNYSLQYPPNVAQVPIVGPIICGQGKIVMYQNEHSSFGNGLIRNVKFAYIDGEGSSRMIPLPDKLVYMADGDNIVNITPEAGSSNLYVLLNSAIFTKDEFFDISSCAKLKKQQFQDVYATGNQFLGGFHFPIAPIAGFVYQI